MRSGIPVARRSYAPWPVDDRDRGTSGRAGRPQVGVVCVRGGSPSLLRRYSDGDLVRSESRNPGRIYRLARGVFPRRGQRTDHVDGDRLDHAGRTSRGHQRCRLQRGARQLQPGRDDRRRRRAGVQRRGVRAMPHARRGRRRRRADRAPVRPGRQRHLRSRWPTRAARCASCSRPRHVPERHAGAAPCRSSTSRPTPRSTTSDG